MAGFESWLIPEFLEELLRHDLAEPRLSVTRGEVKPAVAAGENFGSILYRATAEYRLSNNHQGRQSFIIKTLPPDGVVSQMLQERGFFPKEIHMYQHTLPVMYSLLEQKLPTGTTLQPLTAKAFPCTEQQTIILQDLTTLGYKTADKRRGLNLEHCLVTVKSLAKFHAMSVALHKQDPKSMDNFQENMYTEDNSTLKGMIEPGLQVLSSVVEKWEGYERFGDKIRNLCHTAVDRIVEVMKPDKDQFLVLNHGDCWVNNILFRYSPESGEVVDVRFVDFQLSRFASPALDLQYFLHTSPCEVVRTQCVDQLLQVYHSSLQDTLRTLACDPDLFSLDQLRSDMQSKDFLGLMTSLCVLCVVLADPDKPVWDMHSAPRYRKALQTLLLHFEEKGVL